MALRPSESCSVTDSALRRLRGPLLSHLFCTRTSLPEQHARPAACLRGPHCRSRRVGPDPATLILFLGGHRNSSVTGTPRALARRRSTGSEGFFLSPVSSWAMYPGVTCAFLAKARCVIPLDSLSV